MNEVIFKTTQTDKAKNYNCVSNVILFNIENKMFLRARRKYITYYTCPTAIHMKNILTNNILHEE